DARWLSLAAPRFLVRVPYGKRSDECAFPFGEIDGSSDHDAYLWGSPAVLCAVAIGAAVAAGDGAPTRASVENMPLYVAGTGVDATTVPCAEAVLSQRAGVEMLDRGLTPLACPRDGDTVLLPRIQSIAMPASPLAIRTEARR